MVARSGQLGMRVSWCQEPRLEQAAAVAGSGQLGALASWCQEPWLDQAVAVAGSGQQGALAFWCQMPDQSRLLWLLEVGGRGRSLSSARFPC